MTHGQTTKATASWLSQARRDPRAADTRPVREVARVFCNTKEIKATGNRYYREIDRFFTWIEDIVGIDTDDDPDLIGVDQLEAWITYQRSEHLDDHPGDCITDCAQLKKKPYATASIRRRLAVVASYYDYAVLHKRATHNPARGHKVGKIHQTRDTLAPNELATLLAAARRTHPHLLPNRIAINLRNAALVALLGGAGLRREEAASLRIEKIGFDHVGRPTINFIRKGGSETTIQISLPVYQAIKEAAGDRTEGPVLLSESRRRGKSGDHLSLTSIDRIITDLGIRTGIRGGDLYPHLFRKTAITLALTLPETSIEQVMAYFGHTNTKTTSGYDAFRKMIFKDIAVNPIQDREFWRGLDLAV